MNIADCFGIVAPYYNLVLVIIVGFMFLRLFQMPNKGIFIVPWKILFGGLCIYIVEEVLNILSIIDVLQTPRIINAVFEMLMITLFIYLLLLQKDYMEQRKMV